MNALRQEPGPQQSRAEVLRRTVQNMTAAERVCRRFSAGRPANELRTAQEAVWMASGLKQQLTIASQEEGLKPEDCEVHIAALTPDLTMLLTYRFDDSSADKMKDLHAKITSVCSIMVGLVFAIRERDAKKIKEHGGPHFVLGAKKFLDTKLVDAALNQRMKDSEAGIA